MQELIRELRQKINTWNPSEDNEGILFELNQLFIAVRDRIPPELTPSLEKFMHLHALLRRPKESPLGEFEKELGQILRPRYRVWEVKNHTEMLKGWIEKQSKQSLEVTRAGLDILCESLSFIRESLPEVKTQAKEAQVPGLRTSNGRRWRVGERNQEKSLNLFSKEVRNA